MKKKNNLISAISALTPTVVWDVKTGEEVTEWTPAVASLLLHVQEECVRLTSSPVDVLRVVEGWSGSPKANVHAARSGVNAISSLPSGTRAKSRIERLVRDKLMTELAAYTRNPNPKKQFPTFYPKINLGAVDKQMATLSVEGDELTLHWKVWDRELLFTFNLPAFVLKRDIIKWSLPVVQASRKTGLPVFLFAYEEAPQSRPARRHPEKVGVDLGRVEPFTAAVLNHEGRRVAHYTSSGRLKRLSLKRTRLLAEKKAVRLKLTQYEKLSFNESRQETYKTLLSHLTSKIRTLGTEIAHLTGSELTRKLTKHAVNQVNLEDLSWVHGQKYGGRWNHAATQQAVTHSLAREGIKTVTVNPKNTSQHCHACATPVTHSTKKRTVRCEPCQTELDRDYNAAINIANKTRNPYPESKRALGDNLTRNLDVVHETHAKSAATPKVARLTT